MPSSSARPWLDRYERPFPIRSRGAYHVVSAVRSLDERPCVVVVPSTRMTREAAVEAFREIERVHDLIDHPLVPRVSARGDAAGAPYLELDCDATMDGVEVRELLVDMSCRIPFPCADGFFRVLQDGLKRAHAVIDPVLGRAVCLGRLSPANLLFSRSGRFCLAGYGHNFPTVPGEENTESWPPIFAAPDVLAGKAPTPADDMEALLRFMRFLLPLVDLGPALLQLLDAGPGPAGPTCHDPMRGLAAPLGVAPPRPPGAGAVTELVLDRLRALHGPPDPGGFEAFLRGVFARWAPDARGTLDAPADNWPLKKK